MIYTAVNEVTNNHDLIIAKAKNTFKVFFFPPHSFSVFFFIAVLLVVEQLKLITSRT